MKLTDNHSSTRLKSIRFLLLGIFGTIIIPVFFSSCEDKIKATESFMANVPVYMPLSEFRSVKNVSTAKDMEQPGKICMYGNYLFINEIQKGIHIINNTDPTHPKNVGFIEILGNVEMAVIDHFLFVDSYKDLICFDINNPEAPTTVSRTENAFPYVFPPTGNGYPIDEIDERKGIIVSWEVKKIVREKNLNPRNIICYDSQGREFYSAYSKGTAPSSGGSVAITGSMARFAVNGDYLYAIDTWNYNIKSFLFDGTKANYFNTTYLNRNVETVFCYNDFLFFGTSSGLLIYSLENPATPTYLSSTNHILGCDPVVVQGDYAYSTVRMGNACGQGSSLLDVTDVSNPASPRLVSSLAMSEPYGLSISGNRLFVCDNGLKVFDATDPGTIGKSQLMKSFSGMHGYDVIAYNNLLMLIGDDGLFQYDYSDPDHIRLLSAIAIKK